MSEPRRRRVLSELNPHKTPPFKRRRNSLGFQMVKIASSPKTAMNHRGSFIPVLNPDSRGLKQRLSFERHIRSESGYEKGNGDGDRYETGNENENKNGYENGYKNSRRESKFGHQPYPNHTEKQERKEINDIENDWSHSQAGESSGVSNAEKYRRLLTINNNLNLKTRIKEDVSRRMSPQKGNSPTVAVHENGSAYTDELNKESKRLDEEIALANVQLAQVEEETMQFRLLYKALRSEAQELEKLVHDSEGRFEFLSTQITNKVEKEEHVVHQQLQKLRSDRDHFLRESRLEVEHEINAKLAKDDVGASEEVKSAQERLSEVQEQLVAFSAEKKRQIDAEKEQNARQVLALESAAQENPVVSEKKALLELLQEQLRLENEQLKMLEKDHESVGREIQAAEESVAEANRAFSAGDADELRLRTQIQAEHRASEKLLDLSRSAEARLSQARNEFSAENDKFQRYLANRRSLEFSIMCYKRKFDILVVPEQDLSSFSVSDWTVTAGSNCHDFKVVSVGTGPLSVSLQDVSMEWKLLITEREQALFFRFFGHPADHKAIFGALDDSIHEVYFQSVAEKDGNLVDLLGEGEVLIEGDVVSEKRRINRGDDMELGHMPSLQIFSGHGPPIYVASFSETDKGDVWDSVTQDCTVINVCDLRDSSNAEWSFQQACIFCDGQ